MSTTSGHTRPTRSTWCGTVARWRSRPAPRRASRSATRFPIAEAVTGCAPAPHCCSSPPRRSRTTSCGASPTSDVPGLLAASYDGDTGPEERAWARRHANVLLTNPEMLHDGILPNHARWATFLMRLALRRDRRAPHPARHLRHARRSPAAPPAPALRALRRRSRLRLLQCDHRRAGTPGDRAVRHRRRPRSASTAHRGASGWFALWNPPIDDARRATLLPPRDGLAHRRARVELIGAPSRSAAAARAPRWSPPDARRQLPVDAREIASRRTAAATSSTSDARSKPRCSTDDLHGGRRHHRTRARHRHRRSRRVRARRLPRDDRIDVAAGRPGRARGTAIARDARRRRRPTRPVAHGPSRPRSSPGRPSPRSSTRRTASCCSRISRARPTSCRSPTRRAVVARPARRRCPRARARRSPAARGRVRADVAGRGVGPRPAAGPRRRRCVRAGGDEVRIATADGDLVGTVDHSRAPGVVHPGAIYLHQGARVARAPSSTSTGGRATVEPLDGSEYTQPRSEIDIRVLDGRYHRVGRRGGPLARRRRGGVTGHGLPPPRHFTGELLGDEELDLPPSRSRDAGVLVHGRSSGSRPCTDRPGRLARARCTPSSTPRSGILPLFTICDRWDVGGVSTALQADTGMPTIVIYDGYPGGVGIAELGFAAARRHLEATLDVVSSCSCTSGLSIVCPVAEVRERQRTARQGRRDRAPASDTRLIRSSRSGCALFAPHSTRIVAVACITTSPRSAPTSGTSVGTR